MKKIGPKRIAIFLATVSGAFAGDPVAFEPLPVGDTIEVAFVSQGCFHTERLEFVFERGAALTAKVTRADQYLLEAKEKDKQPKVVSERVALGAATLTPEETAGLDRLFAFYRANPRGGCTTVDTITAMHKRGGAIQAQEVFTDASCSTDEMKTLTRLRDIARRLEEKQR